MALDGCTPIASGKREPLSRLPSGQLGALPDACGPRFVRDHRRSLVARTRALFFGVKPWHRGSFIAVRIEVVVPPAEERHQGHDRLSRSSSRRKYADLRHSILRRDRRRFGLMESHSRRCFGCARKDRGSTASGIPHDRFSNPIHSAPLSANCLIEFGGPPGTDAAKRLSKLLDISAAEKQFVR